VTKKLLLVGILLIYLGLSVLFAACGNYANIQQEEAATYSYGNSQEYEINSFDERSVNQNNNIQYWGFAIMIEDSIYFADGVGIHKTDASFEHTETLVLNENYPNSPGLNATRFNSLQYHNGKIFFLNQTDSAIYSMDIYGNNITPIFRASQIDQGGTIFEFIVIGKELYFYYFYGSSELISFNIETNEITYYHLRPSPIFSLSPDGYELHLIHDWEFTAMNLLDNTVRSAMPSNFETLFDKGHLSHIFYRTAIGEEIAFAASSIYGGRIFTTDKQWYATEIYHDKESFIFPYINSINEWIYFTSSSLGDTSIHLYRIRNDGSSKELILENIASAEHGIPSVILNIFSEDIILFKTDPTLHSVYALIRNLYTSEFEAKRIN